MQIYNYDSKTKIYLSEETADLDPIDQLPLIPASATDVAVISVASGNVAVFENGTWVEMEDNRGEIYNTTTKDVIILEELGPVPPDYTTYKPTKSQSWTGSAWATDLELLKIEKKNTITVAFNDTIKLGYTTNSIKMDADLNDILALDAGFRLSQNLNQIDITIRDFNNNTYILTHIEIQTMIDELGLNYQSLLHKKWTLQSNVDNVLNELDLDSITW